MEQYGYTADQLDALNIQSFLVGNLLPVTIGNIIGGMVVVGLPLWFLHARKVK
jgi:formate/nitrite transporter FocA (FNT family)